MPLLFPARVRPLLRKLAVVTVAAGAAVTVTVAPASADTREVTDTVGDVTSGADLTRVRVVHDHRLRVRTWHADLTRAGNRGASIYLDTNGKRPGPELALFTGLNDGSDYGMTRIRNWQQTGGMLDCFYDVDLDYARDTALVRIGRNCLGDATKVRVAVRVGDYREPDGTNVTDWLVARRHLTTWVHRDQPRC